MAKNPPKFQSLKGILVNFNDEAIAWLCWRQHCFNPSKGFW
ncbi:hypothetical protein CKA32_001389 [Geitlerinema sp. FC II]|nr:hypothetical protein CKA32_001389 [Geitlerinema sp. FC II]